MRNIEIMASVLALTAGAAMAGGIDRSRLSYGVLFEQGDYVEFGLSRVSPSVTGGYLPGAPPAGLGGGSTGDMAGDYTSFNLSFKKDINERLSFGLFLNTPYGADASYGSGAYTGLTATWDSTQVAGVLRYEVTPAVSVYGGLRVVRSTAEIDIPDLLIRGGFARAAQDPTRTPAERAAAAAIATNPASLAYTADGAADDKVGFIIGAAYEKPEIALRVGLTYESGFDHKFDTVENLPTLGLVNFRSVTTVEMPQTLTLDFQSGIAKDTLLFGSLRWSEWSVWKVQPDGYDSLFSTDITSFDNDVLTWQLGVGRRLNENLSVFARGSYEKSNGGVASRLSPTDGQKTFGIGGTYTKDNIKVTGGIEYVDVGDAVDGSGTRFAGNHGIGFGLSVGYRF